MTTAFQHLWSMNPDGTGLAAYFGNMNWEGGDPASSTPGPIPGTDEVVYVARRHMAPTSTPGCLMRLQRAPAVPTISPQARAFTGEGFRDPFPLSADRVSRGARQRTGHRHGPRARSRSLWTVGHDGSRAAPHRAASARAGRFPRALIPTKTTGTLFLPNVYIGRNMARPRRRGTVKKLLVHGATAQARQLPRRRLARRSAHGGKWTINRILGTVPVEADGSASFEVPAGRSIYLAALDEHDLSVKQMRSLRHRPARRDAPVASAATSTAADARPPAAPLAAQPRAQPDRAHRRRAGDPGFPARHPAHPRPPLRLLPQRRTSATAASS